MKEIKLTPKFKIGQKVYIIEERDFKELLDLYNKYNK